MIPLRTSLTGALALVVMYGCSEPPPEPNGAADAPPAVADETAASASAPAEEAPEPLSDVETAEAFIDAFYSFDAGRLSPFLVYAGESVAPIIYYQGWAEGGNYRIVDRGACTETAPGSVVCPITVEDDPVKALGTGFNVTDTFTLTFDAGRIFAIETSSNDQPIYYAAQQWVRTNMPEVMDGPCQGFFAGGPTPRDCARAMTEGYRAFAASDDFPGTP
jgi:hypothetical protein